MLRYFFGYKADSAVEDLYRKAVAQARLPVFYRSFGVADTVDGRFEMIVFHVSPLIDRLRDDKGATLDAGQGLFDTFVNDMEGNLRTIGIGDISVPKKMKKLGQGIYGRLEAYRRSVGDEAELALVIARNVLDDASAAGRAEARALAAYFAAVHAAAGASPDPVAGFAFPDTTPFVPAAEGVRP